MFYVNLEELPLLEQKLKSFSLEKFNFFSFRQNEHFKSGENHSSPRSHICAYLSKNGITVTDEKVMLLTNMNVLGYNFNPVSFYFILDNSGLAKYCVAEVSNTYREMKLYLLTEENMHQNTFALETKKYFYVSPFFDTDDDFSFQLAVPGEKLNLKIDTVHEGRKVFISTLTGHKKALTNRALLWYSLCFPLIPLRIMFLIHWNALLLWSKKIKFHPKAANPDMQQNVYNKY